MNIGINVLSLFDGMSCGQLALQRAGIKVNQYFASEIDKHAIKVTMANFPDTIQLGDITKVFSKDLPKIDLIIGGSPCQGFSFAGKGLNFEDPRSKLFFEFARLWKECKPQFFLLENVVMKKEYELVISKYLSNISPIKINSSLVSAQNRVRLYWTNINQKSSGLFGDLQNNIPQPKDKKIKLKDILEENAPERYFLSEKMIKYISDSGRIAKKYTSIDGEKSLTLMANYNKSSNGQFCSEKAKCFTAGGHSGGLHSDMELIIEKKQIIQLNQSRESQNRQPYQQNRVYDINGIVPALLADVSSRTHAILLDNYRIRRLTPIECERLQTVPDNYTNHVSNTQRYRMLGNGWTVDVVAHIFSFLN